MARLLRAGAILGLIAGLADGAAAALYVVQVGDGVAALTNDSTVASILKFDDAGGSPTGTIPLPVAASGSNKPFTLTGTATSEGFLALSANGQYLTMAGYAVGAGVNDVADASAAAAPRAVARIAVAGDVVDTSTAFTGDTTYGNDNARSAVSDDGTRFWMSGSLEGVRFATLGGNTSVQLNTTAPTNNRAVNIFNGQLYVSSASGTFQGVSTVGAGLPTTPLQTITQLSGFPTGGTHSPFDFWFKDANTVYVADDSTAVNGGGIQKWIQSGGTWSLAYVLTNNGTATTTVRGLTGKVDGDNVVLYATTATTSANRLVSIVDSGTGGGTPTTLATAPMNTVFRGVEFVGAATPPVNDADYNNDGDVDNEDLAVWTAAFGESALGTADQDTDTDGADFLIWQRTYTGPLLVGQAVPEPGAAGLAALGLLAWRGAGRKSPR